MIYAVSDIHGCYDKYRDLLKAISFGKNDILYVLGDVIDRGPDGFQILLDMAQRPNVINLMGNHEAMAIDALSYLSGSKLTSEDDGERAVKLWFCNGGEVSLLDYLQMSSEQKKVIWSYLLTMPLYKEIEVNGRKFLLLHGGLEHFYPGRPLEDYAADEILWCRPKPDTAYYPDRYVVFGHTPVQVLDTGDDVTEAPARIYRNGSLIDIDCGCVFPGGRLGCLCLDTMEEIYV